MTSNQISIRKEVYEKLKKMKREEESFSDVIERLLTKSNIDEVLACFGIVKNAESKEFLEIVSEGQNQMRENLNRRFSNDTDKKED